MEVSALKHAGVAGLHGRSPLLRLQSDERLVALVRRGNHAAFEALVARYQARLHAFCKHMLGSREDAEDVLQEVFAASFNAILADEREINVRPWLYRIARNRSLNHLRRAHAVGVDSMDIHLSEGGLTTADKVHRREEFRLLIGDVQDLPETQRTALLLREIDALSYDQIAEAMETTVPSVKSLLVRARVSLAEASEARSLSCEEVRRELGEVAEGLHRTSAPVRRHVRTCDRCAGFRKQLKDTNKALAAVFPVAPLFLFKKLVLAHIGTTAAAGGGTAAGTAAAGGGAAAAGAAAGGALQAGALAVAGKAAAGLAAAAIVTAGAVEVRHVAGDRPASRGTPVAAVAAPAAKPAAPVAVGSTPQPAAVRPAAKPAAVPAFPGVDGNGGATAPADEAARRKLDDQAPTQPTAGPGGVPAPGTGAGPVATTLPPVSQTDSDTTTLPNAPAAPPPTTGGALGPEEPPPAAVEPPPAPAATQPAPPPAASAPVEMTPAPAPAPQPAARPSPVVDAPVPESTPAAPETPSADAAGEPATP